jgi:hypothetical protein
VSYEQWEEKKVLWFGYSDIWKRQLERGRNEYVQNASEVWEYVENKSNKIHVPRFLQEKKEQMPVTEYASDLREWYGDLENHLQYICKH